MFRTSLITAGALGLAWTAFAQQVEPFVHEIQAKPKHAGTYHLASGTWIRDLPAGINLGPDIVYNNTAEQNRWVSGGIEMETVSFEVVHAGRIPGTTSPTPGANRDNINVNCVEIGYCIFDDALATGPLDVVITLYQFYAACTFPDSYPVAGRFTAMGLPGTNPSNLALGYDTCWTVNFDLSGGGEICLLADGNGVFNNDLDFDTFGIGYEYDPNGAGGYVGAVAVGPMLAGDRNWTVQAAGEILTGTPGGGGGNTYYGPAETCVPILGGENSSGLDSEDLWWTEERPAFVGAGAGCYWFGGYENNIGCNADGQISSSLTNPQAAGHVILMADVSNNCVPVIDGPPDPTTSFCNSANSNSTGGPVTLVGLSIPFDSGLHINAGGGPPNEFGYFLIGMASSPISMSGGLFCLSTVSPNQVGRYNTFGSTNSIGRFNSNGDLVNSRVNSSVAGGFGFDIPLDNPIAGAPNIVTGQTWSFQLWYRDTVSGQGSSNFSNGVSMTF